MTLWRHSHMNFPYYLIEGALLFFPFIGLYIANGFSLVLPKRLFVYLATFFVIHNVLFAFGVSVKGDYFDYTAFGLEYLFLTILIESYRNARRNTFTFLLKAGAFVCWVAGIIIAIPGLLIFATASSEYETERSFQFVSNESSYEVRRYIYGLGNEGTTYSFETYRTFDYLPIELRIDKSIFYYSPEGFDSLEGELSFNIIRTGSTKTLHIQSRTGGSIEKSLK